MKLPVTYYCYTFILFMGLHSGAEQNLPVPETPQWAYPEDDNWPQTCRGPKQSPIAISDNNVIKLTESNKEITLINYEDKISATCVNDGHTVKITLNPQHRLYVIGGGLRGKFQLQQIHFHWTSEHIINGNRVPLEGHFVHVNSNAHDKYKRDASISANSDVQVLSVMYKISIKNNTEIDNLMNSVQQVKKVGSITNIEFTPRALLPDDLSHYYRYEGSLTTPPCYEIVQWTIFSSSVPVSSQQYDMIRVVEGFGGEHITNFRDVMPINDRVIQFYNTANKNLINISLHLFTIISARYFS